MSRASVVRDLIRLVIGLMALLPGTVLLGQAAGDTSAATSENSLLEQVYENRISALQDSVFLAHEQVEASSFLIQQLTQESASLIDSLGVMLERDEQLADSLSRLFVRFDRLARENRQNLARLAAVSDSVALSYGRERELQVLNDSLLIILARTQVYLATVAGNQQAYADTTGSLRNTLNALREDLRESEERFTANFEDLKLGMVTRKEAPLDSTADAKRLRYLEEIVNYRPGRAGFIRRLQARREAAEILTFRLSEIYAYLDLMVLQGNSPEALNLLAQTYIEQDELTRGLLAYLKTLFLFSETESGLKARNELEVQVKGDSEIGRLFHEVAVKPDSVNVGAPFSRFLNYLDHIRHLRNLVAREWFIEQARHFLELYPGISQGDRVLIWLGAAHHDVEQYHMELLTYRKVRALFPRSRYLPRVSYAAAEVTSDNLREYQAAADLYAAFAQEFPRHENAPAALLAQATLYQEQLREYSRAGRICRELADAYPEDSLATVSLFRYADLLHHQLASPTGALAVYEEILERYGDSASIGILALDGQAVISLEARQYDAAIVYYLDIYGRYPEAQEQSVAAILEAADIYESRLKNIDATIHTLHLVLDNYPDYPETRAVQRRVQKLQERRG
ncbi:MAG: hypothetical protein V3U35_06030 [Candidatus Neomarinimicrobiota bacterium]